MDNDTDTFSMTLTAGSIEWLKEHYPDAASRQEAIRMAISDARQHHIGLQSLKQDDDGQAVVEEVPEIENSNK